MKFKFYEEMESFNDGFEGSASCHKVRHSEFLRRVYQFLRRIFVKLIKTAFQFHENTSLRYYEDCSSAPHWNTYHPCAIHYIIHANMNFRCIRSQVTSSCLHGNFKIIAPDLHQTWTHRSPPRAASFHPPTLCPGLQVPQAT